MQSQKSIWVALIAVAIIAVGAMFMALNHSGSDTPAQTAQTVGGITTGTNFKYGISVGSVATLGINPTNFSKFLASTCSLIASSFTVAASTTVPMDCAVTGVVSGDNVLSGFATSTAAGNGWTITGVSASSTSGFLTFRVTNNTGASNVIPASLASSTPYLDWATQ